VAQAGQVVACLGRHRLPRTPADLGMSDPDFAVAVRYAPKTRPGRYTVLERLQLTEAEILGRLADFAKVVAG